MADTSRLVKYSTYKETTKVLLKMIGLWPCHNPCLFYRLLPCLYIFAASVAIFATFNFILQHITQVAIVVRGMGIGTSLITVMLKLCCLLAQRKRATELHHILDHYFSAAISDKQLANKVLAGIEMVRGLCWVLIPTVFIMMTVYTATPLWSIMQQKRHHIAPVTYSLVYPGVYPWNIRSGMIYRVHFAIETLASITIFCVTGGVDALFAYYVFQMIGQLRVMAYRLTHIHEDNDIERVIKGCVEQYEVLLKCKNAMQAIFGPIIVWMIATTAIVQCVLVFQIFQNYRNISLARWVLIVSHLIPKVTQTFIYSWSGSSLIAQSDKYREAIYQVDWLAKKSVMRSVIIMLSQRPIRLTACGFFVISVDMFVMILNTTVSYFFLLKTLDQE